MAFPYPLNAAIQQLKLDRGKVWLYTFYVICLLVNGREVPFRLEAPLTSYRWALGKKDFAACVAGV
jgi:hypothetical protein